MKKRQIIFPLLIALVISLFSGISVMAVSTGTVNFYGADGELIEQITDEETISAEISFIPP